MDNILVTGGAGFIGSHICRSLIKCKTNRVTSVDSLVGGRNRIAGVPLLVADLSNAAEARNVADAVRPNILVHLAADPREGASWYRVDSVTRNNLMAFSSIVEACLRYKLDKVVTFSSMSVYGDQEPPFTEDMPTKPVDPYGVNKEAIEKLTVMLSKAHGFEWTIIRPHNVIGPGQFVDPMRNVATILANKAVRGEPLTVYGDGLQTRAFSNIADSIHCYIDAITLPIASGEIINIGGERKTTILEMADVIRCEVPNLSVVHLPDRFGEVKHAYCNHSKAKKLLGFEERIGWEQAIVDIVRWVKECGPFEWEPLLISTPTDKTPKHWKTQLYD